jgi:hypothetical protein
MRPKVFLLVTFCIALMATTVWLHRHSAAKAASDGVSVSQNQPKREAVNATMVIAKATVTDANGPKPQQSARDLLKERMQAQTGTSSQPGAKNISTIVDFKAGYQSRSSAIKALGSNLSNADRKHLHDFLGQHNSEDDEQLGQVLKNELMDQLTGLDDPGIHDVLSGVYSDNSQQIVLRDYALQHLIESAQIKLDSGELTKPQVTQLQQALWSAVKETDSSLAGTALLGLSRLSVKLPEDFNPSEVQKTAGRYVADGSMTELTQVTAMQICGQMKVGESLPTLLHLAESGATLPLRISAIGALGFLGNASADSILTQIVAGNNAALVPAAKASLHRIRQAQRGGIN